MSEEQLKSGKKYACLYDALLQERRINQEYENLQRENVRFRYIFYLIERSAHMCDLLINILGHERNRRIVIATFIKLMIQPTSYGAKFKTYETQCREDRYMSDADHFVTALNHDRQKSVKNAVTTSRHRLMIGLNHARRHLLYNSRRQNRQTSISKSAAIRIQMMQSNKTEPNSR